MPGDKSQQLHFSRPVVLVGGGDLNLAALNGLSSRGWPLVAADGGANSLRDLDVTPAAIIGDMDSLDDPEHWRSRCQLLQLAEQDTTDFEKCLYSIDAPGFVALGFTGKRFDHTLAVMHSLSVYARRRNIMLLAEQDVLWARQGSTRLQLQAGMRLSVYPLSRVCFESSCGLEYPLDGLVLEQGKAIGTSNRVVEAGVEIRPGAGDDGLYLLITPLESLALLLNQWI